MFSSVAIALLLPFSGPDLDLAAPAAGEGIIGREHEEAEGDHPETENGKKPQYAAEDKRPADDKSSNFRLRISEKLFRHHPFRGFGRYRSYGGKNTRRQGMAVACFRMNA